MIPICYWGFPVNELKISNVEGFEKWWEADNGWWYTVMDEDGGMCATTYCIYYWGA